MSKVQGQERVPDDSLYTFLSRSIVKQSNLIGDLETRLATSNAEIVNLRYRIQLIEQHLGLYFVFPAPMNSEAHLPIVPLSPRQPSE